MKKLVSLVCVLLMFLSCSQEKPVVEKTIIGMYTPYNYFPETVNGKVMEMTETNYFPAEKEGLVEPGLPLTTAARDSISWTPDFTVHISTSGLVEKMTLIGDNGEITGTWEVGNDGSFYTDARWLKNDTVMVKNRITQLDSGVYQFEALDPVLDTLRGKAVFKFNEANNYQSIQWYNFKGEKTSLFNYTYNDEGMLSSYNVTRADTVRGGMNFSRNEQGIMIQQEVFNSIKGTSETTSYEYEYDDAGNWTKCVAYQNEKPFMVAVREYKYY